MKQVVQFSDVLEKTGYDPTPAGKEEVKAYSELFTNSFPAFFRDYLSQCGNNTEPRNVVAHGTGARIQDLTWFKQNYLDTGKATLPVGAVLYEYDTQIGEVYYFVPTESGKDGPVFAATLKGTLKQRIADSFENHVQQVEFNRSNFFGEANIKSFTVNADGLKIADALKKVDFKVEDFSDSVIVCATGADKLKLYGERRANGEMAMIAVYTGINTMPIGRLEELTTQITALIR